MTVGELIIKLSEASSDAIVRLGCAPGRLEAITITVNGYVILDAARPKPVAILTRSGHPG